MKTLILVNLLIFSLNVAADPVLLNKDDKSPYQGLLFSISEAQDLRKELIDKDYLKLQNDSLNRSLELYKSNENLYTQQKQLLLDQNDKLAKSLYQERQVTNWERLGLVLLGVGLTGLAVWGAGQLK